MSNKQIASELDITEGTVKCHLHTVYNKLGIASRYSLILSGSFEESSSGLLDRRRKWKAQAVA